MRIEDAALLRGEAQFTDDLRLAGAVHGVFVRSSHAHARLLAVDCDAARRFPGVIAVLTATDIGPAVDLARAVAQSGRQGSMLVVPPRPVLAVGRVVHVGEPIVLVVAQALAIAHDAAELVDVSYEALPALVSAAGAPPIWAAAPDNVALDWVAPDEDMERQVDAAIAAATEVVRIRVANQRIAGAPMETRAATAVFDVSSARYTLYAPSQSASVLKASLCSALGIDADALRVFSGAVGGAFGLKVAATPEYVALLVAARLTGRPVRWAATRAEAFLGDHQARDNVSDATLALDDVGCFLALKVSAVTNLGAYVGHGGNHIATVNFARCFPTVYDIPLVSVAVRLCFTNTIPTGPYRGAGRPEANFVIERLVDAAARQLGVEAGALRRLNMMRPVSMPARTALGNVYDSGDFVAVLARAEALADVAGFMERRRRSEAAGRLRGLGISCFLEHAGGPGRDGVALEVCDGRVMARFAMHPSGQGHATTFGAELARRLEVPCEVIDVVQGDSEVPVSGAPAVGSRSAAAATAAIGAGSAELLRQARAAVARFFGATMERVLYADGLFRCAGSNETISLFELARWMAGEEGMPLSIVSHVDTQGTFPNGCHIAEVEIDPETGVVAIVGYAAVDDCGTVLDRQLAEGQVVGGVAQGLGQALLERVVYDEAGQVLSATFLDYAMLRADAMPAVASEFHAIPAKGNAAGVKGIGEAGTTAAIGAIMNAIADAIPGADIPMPATPERVWRALAVRRDGRASL